MRRRNNGTVVVLTMLLIVVIIAAAIMGLMLYFNTMNDQNIDGYHTTGTPVTEVTQTQTETPSTEPTPEPTPNYEEIISSKDDEISELTAQIEDLMTALENEKKNSSIRENNLKDQGKKICYLTFDDGPSPNTASILSTLKKHDIKATFFVVGTNCEGRTEDLKNIVADGHALGLHSTNHKYKEIYKSYDVFLADNQKLFDLIYELTGVKTYITRFPGGSNNLVNSGVGNDGKRAFMKELCKRLNEQGFIYYDWHVDSLDASKASAERSVILNAVVNQCVGRKNNAIVLMHDAYGKKTTADALDEMITRLKEDGWIFRAMDETVQTIQFMKPNE